MSPLENMKVTVYLISWMAPGVSASQGKPCCTMGELNPRLVLESLGQQTTPGQQVQNHALSGYSPPLTAKLPLMWSLKCMKLFDVITLWGSSPPYYIALLLSVSVGTLVILELTSLVKSVHLRVRETSSKPPSWVTIYTHTT